MVGRCYIVKPWTSSIDKANIDCKSVLGYLSQQSHRALLPRCQQSQYNSRHYSLKFAGRNRYASNTSTNYRISRQPLMSTPSPSSATTTSSTQFANTDSNSPSLETNNSQEVASNPTTILINDDYTWETYHDCMTEVLSLTRVIKKTPPPVVEDVQRYLLLNQQVVDSDTIPKLDDKDLSASLKEYRSQFATRVNYQTNNTAWTKAHFEYCTRCLAYVGDKCAKLSQHEPVVVAWKKLRETGIIPRERLVSTFLYVLGEADLDDDICSNVAVFHDLLYEPTENTLFLRLKYLTSQPNCKENIQTAENLLASLSTDNASYECQRLRTYLPLLQHYSSVNDASSLLRLFRSMRESQGVYIDADTFALIIGTLARIRVFTEADNGVFVQDADKYGFSANGGAVLLDEIMTEMSEELLEITEAAAMTLYNAFSAGFAANDRSSKDVVTNLDNLANDSSVPYCTESVNGIRIGRVAVDRTSATCPASGVKLRLITLTESQQLNVYNTLHDMAVAQHEEYSEKLRAKSKKAVNRGDSTEARENLAAFSNWLSERDGSPFTAIVDGANIAYAGHGDVHYSQVREVVKKLESIGENPLVVMPAKYMASSFYLSMGATQVLKEEDLAIRDDLVASEKIYSVPALYLDDYYWMIASVVKQKSSTQIISVHDSTGRFPGLRPFLVTNDKMRDHKLELLEPRLFRRWTSSYIVNYYLEPYVESEWEDRDVQFFPAEVFSSEIQSNSAVHEEETGNVWHIPVSEWAENDRLCIHVFTSHSKTE